MFMMERDKSQFRTIFGLLELIYVATVRSVRGGNRSAVLGMVGNILQSMVLLAVFYVMFSLLGIKGMAIRGDFVLYLLTGIFLFMTHIKAVSAVAGSEGPTSAMMKHAPMNTAIAIAAAALGSLYTQVLSVVVILFLAHAVLAPIVIEQPIGAMGMFLAAWFSGCAVGMVILAIKPFMPTVSSIISMLYRRVQMVASGKMFVANSIGSANLKWFDWNPLFHSIDQARGYTFVNYNPMFTSNTYPVYVGLALIMIGLMGEFSARQKASLSWYAGR